MTDDLIARIRRLAAERRAIVLAHNYQPPEIQDIADITGDSLGLSREAAATEAEVIVFCGVHFMAQTAKLLSPGKTVVMPEPEAGCPMADMVSPERLRAFKAQHPGAPVVAYVNTTAEVKAESDICCTSANAPQVVRSLGDLPEILFVPDQHLARWVQQQTGANLVPYPGFCPTHMTITADMVRRAKQEHPDALVIAHPECRQEVVELADKVLSTSGMLRFCRETEAREIIVATEKGILHPLQQDSPGKTFYGFEEAVCPNMKRTTLEKVVHSLEELGPEVTVSEDIAARARQAVQRMVEIG